MNTLSKNHIYYPMQQKLLFPTMHESFLRGETIPVKELAGRIEYTVNTARQTLSHRIQWINH